MKYIFTNGEELLDICKKDNISISDVSILREIELTDKKRRFVEKNIIKAWKVMKESVKESLKSNICKGWFIGGESKKLQEQIDNKKNICGNVISKAVTYSMGVLEVNASMGIIVASPTAGSSGVLPGVLLALQDEYGFSDEDIMKAIANAGAVGEIISRNANVSGAEGGCQAEVGSASAMAASAVTELMGGTPEMCLTAASFAISNLLGLICDPVGGLVEVPCQGRNAIGSSGALVAAEIALAGIKYLVPFDEVVYTMQDVGDHLLPEFRETAKGGIAITPTACKLCKKMIKERNDV